MKNLLLVVLVVLGVGSFATGFASDSFQLDNPLQMCHDGQC